MAIFKGQVPFEIPNDDDDSKTTNDENMELKKIQYCFLSDKPSLEEIESEIKRVRNNLKKMSNEEVYDNVPEDIITGIKISLRGMYELHPNKDGSDSIEDKKIIGSHIRAFINSQTADSIYKELNLSDEEKALVSDEVKEKIAKAQEKMAAAVAGAKSKPSEQKKAKK